jgi:hypothetical protein
MGITPSILGVLRQERHLWKALRVLFPEMSLMPTHFAEIRSKVRKKGAYIMNFIIYAPLVVREWTLGLPGWFPTCSSTYRGLVRALNGHLLSEGIHLP